MAITQEMTLYSSWNQRVSLGGYLKSLLASYQLNPYFMIPENMITGSAFNNTDIVSDFSSFVDVNQIQYGFGEQWEMVLDNLNQSNSFFRILSVVEGLSSTVIVAFNNYLDSNPDNVNSFEFTARIYTVEIHFDGAILSYVLNYAGKVPVFGEQAIQILLTYNIETLEKTGRIQIGDANALKYQVTENKYCFGIRYLGVRRAYFEIEKKQNHVREGAIFEFLTTTVAGKELTYKSAAQFLIAEEYVSVVGNKADGMIGFENSVNELYQTSTGELLGYEVRKSRSVGPVNVTFNTLWFNLKNQIGISSVRLSKVDDKDVLFVNQNETQFQAMKVGGFTTKRESRRYDIEFRTQYVYVEAEGELVKVKLSVPMLFVQEEQLESLSKDICKSNKQISSFILLISQVIQEKIMSDYNTLIDIFLDNKERITIDHILAYIGSNET